MDMRTIFARCLSRWGIGKAVAPIGTGIERHFSLEI
jgi:hypothetical protein